MGKPMVLVKLDVSYKRYEGGIRALTIPDGQGATFGEQVTLFDVDMTQTRHEVLDVLEVLDVDPCIVKLGPALPRSKWDGSPVEG